MFDVIAKFNRLTTLCFILILLGLSFRHVKESLLYYYCFQKERKQTIKYFWLLLLLSSKTSYSFPFFMFNVCYVLVASNNLTLFYFIIISMLKIQTIKTTNSFIYIYIWFLKESFRLHRVSLNIEFKYKFNLLLLLTINNL